MSSGAELHFSRSAVELPHIEVILTKKDEQRCRRHATKMQLRGKFGQEADRHAARPDGSLRAGGGRVIFSIRFVITAIKSLGD